LHDGKFKVPGTDDDVEGTYNRAKLAI